MGFWAAAGRAFLAMCTTTNVVTIVAVGAVSYIIYQSFQKQEPHSEKDRSSPKPCNSTREFTTFHDIKATGAIHKPEKSESICGKPVGTLRRLVQSKSNSNADDTFDATDCENRCRKETSTCDLPIAENMLSPNVMPASESWCIGASEESASITSEDADTICSFESYETEDFGEHLSCKIPTWHEMSDSEKRLSNCRACDGDNTVETITVPCNHPYMCIECAESLFRFYRKCAIEDCGRKITGYETID